MDTRKIGSLDVSIVGLGTNNFGMRIDEAQSVSVVHAALESGVNFIDTADLYGGTKSEEFIGRALKGRRDEVILATKFGMKIDDDRPGGAKPEYVRSATEDSLRRLQTDHVDLLILHRSDPDTPIGDTLEALGTLIEEGKVIEIGCSSFSADELIEAENVAASGGPRFVNLQSQYNLLQRSVEKDVLPECARSGIAFVPFSPLASGLLTGKFSRGEAPLEGTRIAGMAEERRSTLLNEQNFDILEALSEFCAEHDRSLLDLAFSWLLARPAVVSVIVGATSPKQVLANVAAATWSLSQRDLEIIDEILPLA